MGFESLWWITTTLTSGTNSCSTATGRGRLESQRAVRCGVCGWCRNLDGCQVVRVDVGWFADVNHFAKAFISMPIIDTVKLWEMK